MTDRASGPVVSLRRDGDVAVLTLDKPPVNALSTALRRELLAALEALRDDPAIHGVVIAGAGRVFCAGADVAEFGRPAEAPSLPETLACLDAYPKCTLAAIAGPALGGGAELAMACHYRLAGPDAALGLPEVRLGLIPGAGGTQRLPRLVGVERALDMLWNARRLDARQALDWGMVDALAKDDLLAEAIAWLREHGRAGQDLPSISARVLTRGEDHEQRFAQYRREAARRWPGAPAPAAIVDSLEEALRLPFAEGVAAERQRFLALRDSPQAAAFRHVFFAERACAKQPATPADPVSVRRVAIVGSGAMGIGIAGCFAAAGIPARLLDLDRGRLDDAMRTIARRLERAVERGRLSAEEARRQRAAIDTTETYEDLAEVDLVVEAVFEDLSVKQAVFERLARHCAADCVLATNTSYLDIDAIATATGSPQRVVGMHFFNPAERMRLLEVVRSQRTGDTTVHAAVSVAKRLGKIPVTVGNRYGFAANRSYAAYGNAAQRLLLEGASPAQVDEAMTAWGMAMGPLSVQDLSGMDVGYAARRQNPKPPDDPAYFRPSDLLVEYGMLGQKTHAGFYRYDPETGEKTANEAALALIRAEAKALGIAPVPIVDEQIPARLIEALAREGRDILAAGVIERLDDLDVIWVNGYGFPRWRGGPMFCDARDGV